MSVFSLMATLGIDTSKYDKGLDTAEGKGSKFAQVLGKGFSGLGTVVKTTGTAIVAASGAVAAVGTASVKTGMEFDKSMSQVAATMGTTTDAIQDLREYALQMGESTAFSASQAADALNYMALAGYSSEQSMQALPNVLNLAAAGNIELARASDMVTDAQSALGLSFDESAYLIDQMAVSSSKTNTSVAQLGEAILTVGGTAKNLRGGTSELTQILGLLADNGIKGAEGGTALRNVILSLSSPTNAAAKQLEALGVNVFDANGDMRNMALIFEDLNGGLSKLSQKDKTKAISTIFNKVDLKSVNALLGTSVERWDEVFEAVDHASGAAEKMAETQLDNLAGDITLFKSAVEGAQISISDKLTPSLRTFVQFGTTSVGSLAKAFREGGLAGAMGELGNVISDGLDMLLEFVPDFISGGRDLLLAVVDGILNNSDKILDAAIQIFTIVVDEIPGLITELGGVLSTALELFAQHAPELLSGGKEILLAIIRGIREAAPDLISTGVEVLVMLVQDLPEIIREIGAAIPDIINGIVDALLEPDVLKNLVSAGIDVFLALVQSVSDIVLAIAEVLPDLVDGIVSALLDPDNLVKMLEGGIQLISALFMDVPKILLSLGEALWNIGAGIVDGIGETIRKYGSRIIYDIVDFLTPQWLRDVLKDLGVADIDAYLEGLEEGMNEQEEEVIHNTNQRVKHVTGEAHDVVKREAVNTGKSYMDGIGDGIEENEGELFEKIDVTVGEFIPVEKFVSDTGRTTGEAYTDALGAGATAPDKVSSLTLKLQGLADNVVGQFTKREADVENSGGRMADGLINGFTKKMPSIYTVIRQKVNGMVGVINQTLEIHSPSRVLARTGGFMGDGLGLGFIESVGRWSPIMANAIPTEFDPVRGTWGNANYDIVGTPAFRGGVNIVQNIYADAMSPAQVFEAAREEQEKAMFLGLGGIA